jgi:hypothetical protein
MAEYLANALHKAGEKPLIDQGRGDAYRLALWEGGDIRAFTLFVTAGKATLTEHSTFFRKPQPLRRRTLSNDTYTQFLAYVGTWGIWNRTGPAYEPGLDGPLYLVESVTTAGYRWYVSSQELPELLLAAQWLEQHLE